MLSTLIENRIAQITQIYHRMRTKIFPKNK